MFTILLVSAAPKENHPLNLDQELRRIGKEHEKSKYRDEFELKKLLATTYDDLRSALLTDKPSIIHFCGHGMGEEGLVLVDDNGKEETIDTKQLAELFKILQKENQNISCVVFNICYGDFQAKEIKKYIKYTVGMSHEIKDEHAIAFATTFYQALFTKTKIETAFELGCNSIRHFNNKNNTINISNRTLIYNPAPDDKIADQPIFDYKIPQLEVNENLEDINNLDIGITREAKKIISYQQWCEIQSILLKIDFEILKDVCRDTLRQDVRDIEPKILSLKNLVDLKELLLEQYPIHKNSDRITILNFSNRLTIEKEVSDSQKIEIKNWIEKIAKEKNIDLASLLEKAESEPQILISKAILNSYLLISIIDNTGTEEYSSFSLEAELIANYQEGEPYDKEKSIPITSKQEGVNAISLDQIAPCIRELISITIKQLSTQHILTIELFVPFVFLGKDFDIYEIIPIGSRRTNKKRIGSLYPIIIRCLDRYEEESLFNELEERWDGIREYLSKDREYLEKKCDYLESINQNWDKLYLKWQSNDFFSINLINGLPIDENEKMDYFDCFQLSGVPISLWGRSPGEKCDLNTCNITEKFKEILAIEDFKNLGEIFQRIYNLRRNADSDQNTTKDYLALICDHPERIPYNLLKRLNKEGYKGSN